MVGSYGRTAVIVGQNFPDSTSDKLVEAHDSVFIFEPIEEAAEACRERYSWTGKVAVFDVACGLTPGFSPFHIYNASGRSSSLGLVSAKARELYSNVDLRLQQVRHVFTVNLGSFLNTLGVETIETLLIDAQGMDLTILQTVESLIRKKAIKVIQCEADGDGVHLYDHLPNNSVEAFQSLMSQYPDYRMSFVPNRNTFNPDLMWELE